MTRAALWSCPLLALVAVVLLGADDTAAVGAVLVLGVALGFTLWALELGRLRRLARAVDRWSGGDGTDLPELGTEDQWQDLTTAVDELGEQLRAAQEELGALVPWTERLVSSLAEPAVVLDADRRLVAANAAARDALGLASGPPLQRALPTAISALGSVAAADVVTEALETGRIVTVDERRGERELRISASPLDEHVLVVIADHTRERQVEELRRDFVANASHELKTPVTAIQSLTEALRVAPAERREGLVDRLEEEGARLARLTRDLLDLRELEQGATDPERRPVDLVELVADAVAEQGPSADALGVHVATSLPASAMVTGVRSELRLVVDNLVANAIQYNRDGGDVVIELEAGRGEQVLTVRDTGIGIPQHALPRVFERFYRVDVARSRERGGTGLGLSLVRHAVESHGGRVSVESLLGVGTTVTVHLPVGQPDR